MTQFKWMILCATFCIGLKGFAKWDHLSHPPSFRSGPDLEISNAGIKCSANQKRVLTEAVNLAMKMIDSAVKMAKSGDKKLITRWFGGTNDQIMARLMFVLDRFKKYSHKVAKYCDDCQDATAWAVAWGWTTYYCYDFFAMRNLQHQAHVVIHELSHSWIAGTEDYTLIPHDAKNLARSNPRGALWNADSYAYFAVQAHFGENAQLFSIGGHRTQAGEPHFAGCKH